VYIDPPKSLLDLAHLQGSLFHPSEQRSPAHFNRLGFDMTEIPEPFLHFEPGIDTLTSFKISKGSKISDIPN